MKDQNTIAYEECDATRHNRALDLFIESVIKPDADLRSCAHNQNCYDELMEIRDKVLVYLDKELRQNEKTC